MAGRLVGQCVTRTRPRECGRSPLAANSLLGPVAVDHDGRNAVRRIAAPMGPGSPVGSCHRASGQLAQLGRDGSAQFMPRQVQLPEASGACPAHAEQSRPAILDAGAALADCSGRRSRWGFLHFSGQSAGPCASGCQGCPALPSRPTLSTRAGNMPRGVRRLLPVSTVEWFLLSVPPGFRRQPVRLRRTGDAQDYQKCPG